MVSFGGAGQTLILPSPQLGDRERIDLRFVYKRMMDGTIRSYKMGTPITVLEIEFKNVNRPKVLEVINFLRATAGKIINYVDYREVSWTGRIMNQPFESTHVAIRDNSFTLIFETIDA